MAFKFNPLTGKFDTVSDPAGSDTNIQFNDSGAFGGTSDLTYNKVSKVLTHKGNINLDDGGTFTTTLQCVTPTANRFISLPDATGSVALVAGGSGQLIYNLNGAYAGISSSSVDGSGNVTLGTRFISSVNGAASAPPVALTGTWFTGGTATTTKPAFLVEPTGATSTAWSTSGTGLGVNAPSGFAGRLLDGQINGTSRFSVGSNGEVTVNTPSGFVAAGFAVRRNGVNWFSVQAEDVNSPNNILLVAGVATIWCDREYADRPYFAGSTWGLPVVGSYFRLSGCVLTGDANNVFALRNGTSAQTYRVYNTYTSGSNHERGKLEWSSNIFRVGTEKGSGGGTARAMELQTDGTTRLTLAANGSAITAASGTALVADHRLTGTAPASATATGTAGDIRYDADYIYICTATDTWKRAPLSTW